MLLSGGILDPGPGFMTIEYLGQRFVGDLLEDGKIRSQETDIVFASPSAWAIACKRFINPDKKSGCGWASVKYRGRKLDAYKNIWYKKKKEEEKLEREGLNLEQLLQRNMANTLMYQRIIVKHNTIANRTLTHDANTMIECVPFSNLGKIQPFLVSLHTNAALLMDFHCHLTKAEVSGYLAGHWDVNAHNLQITHAFPLKNVKTDRENAPQVEAEIAKEIDREKLTLVGWYHSHPFAAAAPTLRDVDAQLDYQIKMKGTSDNSYTPCIGIIISPYNYENNSLESSIIAYWVIPPPETKPNEYGRPMLMSYSVIQDTVLNEQIKDEMKRCVEYYQKDPDYINFTDRYISTTLYIDKLKSTLLSKFPRDERESVFWRFIRELLGCCLEEKESLLSIPSVSKASQLLPPVSLGSNFGSMLPGDISSLLFNSGKFPSASSLLGLPDPMAHSTLAANNMFLSTNLFKMQELLKPLSASSPIPKSKEHKSQASPLKIPTDIKSMKSDFSMDLMNLKNKMEFSAPDLNLSKNQKSYVDYSIPSTKASKETPNDYSIPSTDTSKQDFSVPDLSMKSTASDYSINLSNKPTDFSEKPAKIPKLDYSSLDLSISKDLNALRELSASAKDLSEREPSPPKEIDLSKTSEDVTENVAAPTDLSVPSETSAMETSSDDAPLNLAS
ncbi:MPN domain-containing protein CG4751 isoform X2 [Aethina tumida]|nr:MPN domain-containing protein CG4751 isoform X2 [Aethina tumida]